MNRAVCWLALFATLAIALWIRVDVARRLTDFLDPDEAVVALMARHIASGRESPVFYYGQPYLGALEAYGLAAAFKLGDDQPHTVRWFAVAIWLCLLLATFALGWQVGGLEVAVLAATMVSLTSPAVVLWQLKIRGGFALSAALLAAALALSTPTASQAVLSHIRSAAFGFVAGLTVWTNQLTAPAILVATGATWLVGARRPVLAISFLVGSAPLWIYNLVYPLVTVRYFAAHLVANLGEASTNSARLIQETLPNLLGGANLAAQLGVPGLHWLGCSVSLAGLLFLLWTRAKVVSSALRSRSPQHPGDLVLLGLLLSLPARRNYELNQLLHWTPLIAVLLAWLPQAVGRRWLVAAPLTMACLGLVETSIWQPTFGESGSAVRRLVAELNAHGVDGVFAEHRPAYLIAVFSDERIAVSPSLSFGYQVDRYPPYAARVAGAQRPAWVFEASSANEVQARHSGVVAGEPTAVAGYHVYLSAPRRD